MVAVLFCKARGIRVVLGSRGTAGLRFFLGDVDEDLVETMLGFRCQQCLKPRDV